MSTQLFPTLSGLEWDIKRSEIWGGTTIQESVSGKRTGIQNWSSPRYSWEVSVSVLPAIASMSNAPSSADFPSLFGFFNSRGGRFDTFLYQDLDDNTSTAQSLGTGNSSAVKFQLVKTYGGYVEPVFAPHTVSNVYLDAVALGSSLWSVQGWGSTAPGVVTFTSAPGSTQAISANFTYYFPVRFDEDIATYNNFMKYLYENKSIKFSSEK